ncbi:DUF2785 domain-containing protein [Streptomyces sp. NPDC005784]|uniref:DUF2785 domain-containing protein n=1 Tax=Streptomyces sp. NPDC005784 TaxID=3364731 RepID=UPI0036D06AE9
MPMDHSTWSSIAAEDFPFPEGVPASRLGDELSAMFVHPGPRVRDDQAYTAAARWIAEGRLDEVLEDLGDTAADRFTHPEIQARTFAPLVLRCVLARAVAAPGAVPGAAAERWYVPFAAWYPAERDTRGWDDSLGWLHAVAHGADAAAAFAQALPGRRAELLELCARRMTAAADHRYVQLEDARLARAICRILLVPGLSAEQATGWLSVVAEALEGGGPGPVPPWAFNTFATLQSLHLHLTRGLAEEGVPAHAGAVAANVAAVLQLPYHWLA